MQQGFKIDNLTVDTLSSLLKIKQGNFYRYRKESESVVEVKRKLFEHKYGKKGSRIGNFKHYYYNIIKERFSTRKKLERNRDEWEELREDFNESANFFFSGEANQKICDKIWLQFYNEFWQSKPFNWK